MKCLYFHPSAGQLQAAAKREASRQGAAVVVLQDKVAALEEALQQQDQPFGQLSLGPLFATYEEGMSRMQAAYEVGSIHGGGILS
jgi:hypothetical protein